MAEQTANTVKVNVETEYTFNHDTQNFLEAAGLSLADNKAFEQLFKTLVSGDFDGKKKSEICQAILEQNNPEVIKVLIILGMDEFFSKILEFEAMLALRGMQNFMSEDMGQA